MAGTFKEEALKLRENLDKVYDAGYAEGAQVAAGDMYDSGFSAGQKAEYDAFWDEYQRESIDNWEYAFYGLPWNDKTYKPKHPIIGGISNTFRAGRFKNTIVPIIVEGGTSQAFAYSQVVTIPHIDLTNATNTSTCFNNANRLVDVTFAGTILTTINLQSASGLSVASMKSAILHLANYAGTEKANVNALYFTEDCWAALEADSVSPTGTTWAEYVGSLGWNV